MTTPRGIPQIRFAALSFDPLTDRVVSPDTGGSQAIAGAAERVVVQFHAPLTRRDQERLKSEYGLALRDYVPDYAYLEQLTTATLEKLRQDPLVRATVAYHAAFKIVPGIGQREFRTEERRAVKGLWITCVLFRDADPEPVAKAIEAIAAREVVVVDDRRVGGAPKINVIVDSPLAVQAIAALRDVKLIEEVPETLDDNSGAAGTNQSGVATTQSIWSQGLHGEGQIIGMIDRSPLDIAHCFFLDPVDNTLANKRRRQADV